MNRQLTVKSLSALANTCMCLIVLAASLYSQDWFRAGAGTFTIWIMPLWLAACTIPLGIALAISGTTIVSLIKTTNVFLRVLFIIFLSVLVAYGWMQLVILVLGGWLYNFNFPAFYMWTIGNFCQLLILDNALSKESKPMLKVAAIAFFAPLTGSLIVLYSFMTLYSYMRRPIPETYLIKETFDGIVRVVYGEECGVEPRIENGRRILEVPDNGLLLIKPEFKEGPPDHEYYLVYSTGGRARMNKLWMYDQRKTMAPGVLMMGPGFMGETQDSSFQVPLIEFQYNDFVVFNKATAEIDERTRTEIGDEFDSLTFALVERCRTRVTTP
jgi:hypothetical protein